MRLICSEKVYIIGVVRTKTGLRDWTIRAEANVTPWARSRMAGCKAARRLTSDPHASTEGPSDRGV